MECFRNKLWIVSGVVSIIIGAGVLLGAYLPYRMFNDNARTATCTVTAQTRSRLCRKGSFTHECYDVLIVTRAVDTCWTYQTYATMYDQGLANQLAASLPSYKRTCYYVNPCRPEFSLKDVHGSLWAGCVFTCLAAVCFAFPLATLVYDKWRGRGYTKIEESQV